jgi:hypothetical protein
MFTSRLCIALTVLLPLVLVTVQPPEPCDCTHLKVLQVELRNAQRLQQAFRNKIPALRAMGNINSRREVERFANEDAPRILENLPNYKGTKALNFECRGFTLSALDYPWPTETNESLCRPTAAFEAALQEAIQASDCEGIGKAVQAHEEVHHNSCLREGFVRYYSRSGADQAQDEVDGYEAQINVLRAEIAQVLERSQFTVILDMKTRAQPPANHPFPNAINMDDHAEIQTASVSGSADKFRFTGQGQQTTNVSIEGRCRVTGGVPYTLPAQVTIETDGLTADVRFKITGTMPRIGLTCQTAYGTGYGMSMPLPINTAKIPIVRMPLKDGAEVVFDMSGSEAGEMVPRGGVQLTCKVTVRLVCHK